MATEVDLTYLGRLFINQLWSSLTSDSSDFVVHSVDTAIVAPNTLPMLLRQLRWTVPPQTYGQQVHPRTLRGQQRVMFKGIHTLATIKGIKGSD